MDYAGRKIPILYQDKEDCCGCGACMNICPRNAISMREDECGFIYPQIDSSICVKCGRCKSVCAFQNREEKNEPLRTYAAVSKNRKQASKSASGGIFAAIASNVLQQGGVAIGAAFDEEWNLRHICIEDMSDLCELQGSKYVHSSTNTTFRQAERYLKDGSMVLYSGTPCQIAGLYAYLGRDYENLLTVDIICHGVPSNRIFKDYLNYIEKNKGGKVTAFTFRDKNIGWGINGRLEISNGLEKNSIRIWQSASSYLYYFIQGWLYRKNCYNCKYACSHRPADITLGDYWGIEKVHREYLGHTGWNEAEGISVVVANTEKGCNYLSTLGQSIEMKSSDFEKAAVHNPQLNNPSKPGMRNEIMRIYAESGWDALEQQFKRNVGIKRYSSYMKALIPVPVKRMLKRYL